jgi:MFS transporter, OPA family, glycerol-3-phosphate transporter
MSVSPCDPTPKIVPRSFRRAQWRTLFLVMFCYLFFYTGRQNFGFAARGMQEEMALSTTSLGLFNAVLLVGYGVGQAINGNLGDIYGARRMVTIGAFFSVALNWAVSFAPNFGWALVCWGANGLAQSCAWPAMNRAIAHWWPRRERGKAIGLYLLAAGFSIDVSAVHSRDPPSRLAMGLSPARPIHDRGRRRVRGLRAQ